MEIGFPEARKALSTNGAGRCESVIRSEDEDESVVSRCVGVVDAFLGSELAQFPQCRLVRVSRGQRRPLGAKRQKTSSNADPRSERNGQNSRKPASSLTGRAARWAAGLASVAGVGTLDGGGAPPAVLWEMGPSRGMNHWDRGGLREKR
jgi:hypothetical protein